MHGTDLLLLKAELDLESNKELIRKLGVAETTFYSMLPRAKLPLYMALAAAALKAGLEPYAPDPTLDIDLVRKHSASTLRWLSDIKPGNGHDSVTATRIAPV